MQADATSPQRKHTNHTVTSLPGPSPYAPSRSVLQAPPRLSDPRAPQLYGLQLILDRGELWLVRMGSWRGRVGWGLDRTQEPQVGVLPSFGSTEA